MVNIKWEVSVWGRTSKNRCKHPHDEDLWDCSGILSSKVNDHGIVDVNLGYRNMLSYSVRRTQLQSMGISFRLLERLRDAYVYIIEQFITTEKRFYASHYSRDKRWFLDLTRVSPLTFHFPRLAAQNKSREYIPFSIFETRVLNSFDLQLCYDVLF